MADIDVVKKRSSVWPWVIGVVLLIAAVWLIVSMMGGTHDASRTGHLITQAAAALAA